MMSKRSKSTMGYLVVVVTIFLFCIRYYYIEDYKSMDTVEEHVNGDMIIFGKDSGFYEESLSVSLVKDIEVPSSAQIFYTLDGDDPTANRKEYETPIQLKMTNEIEVYPLKAVVYYNGEYSDIYEKTYVLGTDINKRLDIDLVSISSDRKNLYNYETGILVSGKTYDEESKLNNGNGFIKGNYSNREMEWIRNAHISMFDSAGGVILEQNIGLGVSGGTSSAADVKSLKVYAGREYDKENKDFNININTEGIFYSDYSFVNKYNSIRFRSGSQDIEFGNIRSAVVSRLAQMSGFDGCTATRRCVVYLNGKFYGIFDIQQNYSDSYLANRFGLTDSECIEKYKGIENAAFSEAGIEEYFRKDLNNPRYREMLEKYVDMDDYLLYYAINILCNNTDWPDNNLEIWRYAGEYDEDNRYSDNRYRFLIYDTDLMFNTESTPSFFVGCKEDIFVSLMENVYKASGSRFSNVMKSLYYRNKFITLVMDLLNTSFAYDNIQKIVYEENEKISAARKEFYDTNYVRDSELYVEQIIQTAEKRPEEMANSFSYYFDLNEKYDFELQTSDGITVIWNNMSIFADEIYQNRYYKGTEWILEQVAYPGYTFQYWQVNGENVYDSSLNITDQMIQNGKLSIQAIAAKNDSSEVIISEISAKGTLDWVRISSVGNEVSHLNQYYISDDKDNLQKFRLPNVKLEEGESIIVYGSKNQDSLGDYICNFSLNEDEILYLSDGQMILFYLPIPKMSDIETYGRYDNSNSWKFFAHMSRDE